MTELNKAYKNKSYYKLKRKVLNVEIKN